MRISDWSSDVCSSDLDRDAADRALAARDRREGARHARARTGAFDRRHADPRGTGRRYLPKVLQWPCYPAGGRPFDGPRLSRLAAGARQAKHTTYARRVGYSRGVVVTSWGSSYTK